MPPINKPVSRREFARRAALGAAAAALPLGEFVRPAATSEPQPAQTAAQTAVPDPAQSSAGMPKLSMQKQEEADSRYQSILNQYGDHFSEAQKTDLKRLCVLLQPPLDRIRAYTISNGDLPALYLKPLVDRDKKPATHSASPSPGAKKSSTADTAKPSAPASPSRKAKP